MCGRFSLVDPGEVLRELEPEIIECDLSRPRYNIAPTQEIPALIMRDGKRVLVDLKWGLVPAWAKDPTIGNRMINARAETLAQKPTFKNAFRKTRCLIPADGFYEWRKQPSGKQPMWIRVEQGKPFAFAGLYDIWHAGEGDEIASCTIITTTPNELMQTIHDRMPVILPRDNYPYWLNPKTAGTTELMAMLQPYDAKRMQAHVVSTHINSPKNDDPRCIEILDSV